MTEIDRPLLEVTRLSNEIRKDLVSAMNCPDLGIQQAAVNMAEDLECANGLLEECNDLPLPRMSSGAPGVMYLDAILRMVDGLTEVLEMILAGLKFYQKVSRKMAEYATKIERYNQQMKEMKEMEEAGRMMEANAMKRAIESDVASGFLIEPQGIVMAFPMALASYHVAMASAHNIEDAATQVTEAANEMKKANEYSLEAAIETLEGALCIAKAAYKMVSVVRRTISWANMVLSVEPVCFLPLPITGWDILNLYHWITGDYAPDIIRPIVINLAKGNFNPLTIIQGVMKTPTVRGWIPNEVYDVPKMPFLGGGSIM